MIIAKLVDGLIIMHMILNRKAEISALPCCKRDIAIRPAGYSS